MSELIKSAETGCESFNQSMKSIFPNFLAVARVKKILGNVVVAEFANVASAADAPNGIIMNATGHMRFMMHLGDSQGDYPDGTPVEIGLLMWTHHVRDAGVKFRKIKGKTPAEALEKLAAWFKKNADAINTL